MKKIIFLLLITLVLFECEKDKNEIDGIIINQIAVYDPIIFKKSVVLFDDKNYNIKIPLDTFILGFPFTILEGYEDMKVKAINDSVSKNILSVSDYMKYEDDSIFTLAYYLENGNCYILDKGCNCSIKTIKVETYFIGEPGTLYGGRRFYIRNKLFLETVDLISK
jgi:hypothetical protein